MTYPAPPYNIAQFEVLLMYSLIPAFIILLAILLFFVMRSQLGLFAPSKMPAVSKDSRTNIAGYAMVGTLFLLFIVMAVISRKQQVPA